jgi:hypothetical protein
VVQVLQQKLLLVVVLEQELTKLMVLTEVLVEGQEVTQPLTLVVLVLLRKDMMGEILPLVLQVIDYLEVEVALLELVLIQPLLMVEMVVLL